jgi:hypothetical protein
MRMACRDILFRFARAREKICGQRDLIKQNLRPSTIGRDHSKTLRAITAAILNGRSPPRFVPMILSSRTLSATTAKSSHSQHHSPLSAKPHLELCNAADREGLRRISSLISLPHRGVGGFDMPGKTFGIKEWVGVAVARQLGLDGG